MTAHTNIAARNGAALSALVGHPNASAALMGCVLGLDEYRAHLACRMALHPIPTSESDAEQIARATFRECADAWMQYTAGQDYSARPIDEIESIIERRLAEDGRDNIDVCLELAALDVVSRSAESMDNLGVVIVTMCGPAIIARAATIHAGIAPGTLAHDQAVAKIIEHIDAGAGQPGSWDDHLEAMRATCLRSFQAVIGA